MLKLIVLIKAYWLACTLALLAAITALSLIPMAELPPAPGSDKLHHLIAYAALAVPVSLGRPRYWWLILLSIVAYSALIEVLQPYVNRYGEWLDLAANSAGILGGLVIAELLIRSFPARLN